MRERPIIFSAPMVRAILAGAKTQTRRVVPEKIVDAYYDYDEWCSAVTSPGLQVSREWEEQFFLKRCRYGQPGDRLWVRETWMENPDVDAGNGHGVPLYRATCLNHPDDRWRPSIHMPRWASRITLEVSGVRVERLQDISEADARAEGAIGALDSSIGNNWCAREAFAALWESINGPGSWDANPWVWVVKFARVPA